MEKKADSSHSNPNSATATERENSSKEDEKGTPKQGAVGSESSVRPLIDHEKKLEKNADSSQSNPNPAAASEREKSSKEDEKGTPKQGSVGNEFPALNISTQQPETGSKDKLDSNNKQNEHGKEKAVGTESPASDKTQKISIIYTQQPEQPTTDLKDKLDNNNKQKENGKEKEAVGKESPASGKTSSASSGSQRKASKSPSSKKGMQKTPTKILQKSPKTKLAKGDSSFCMDDTQRESDSQPRKVKSSESPKDFHREPQKEAKPKKPVVAELESDVAINVEKAQRVILMPAAWTPPSKGTPSSSQWTVGSSDQVASPSHEPKQAILVSPKMESTKDKRKGTAILTDLTKEEREVTNWVAEETQNLSYFHALINKDELKILLPKAGDFLLRIGRSQKHAFNVTLSVCGKTGEKPKHYVIERETGAGGVVKQVWIDEGNKFPSEALLCNFYTQKNNLLPNVGREKKRVAIKFFCKPDMTLEEQNQFTKEAHICRRFMHPNVIQSYGVHHRELPLMIVMEFADCGSLKSFLTKKKPHKQKDLVTFAREVNAGMTYLAKMQVIHRDLAARNCLLNSKKVVKISDFGLSKMPMTQYKMVNIVRLALKWLSPESLMYGEFSEKSDVWAYGVTLWEIFNDGGEPYPRMSGKEVKDRVTSEKNPLRLDHTGIPDKLTKVALSCWATEPKDRMTFAQMSKSFSSIFGLNL